jgi:hypothetical protein
MVLFWVFVVGLVDGGTLTVNEIFDLPETKVLNTILLVRLI